MALAIVLVLPLANGSFAQDQEDPSEPTKVLQSDEASFNPGAVERLLSQGDEAVAAGDLETARKHYDDARSAARVLAGFYRDLSGAFRGLDARVPREMDAKGRRSITLQAEANLRLAALYRRLEQPEVAVPLLVDVIKLMTVTSPVGTQAYQQLVELGFAETTYAGPG
ncbi:hypothetical protein [Candidatus Synechococcus spongiarum]